MILEIVAVLSVMSLGAVMGWLRARERDLLQRLLESQPVEYFAT